jgi:hypothetical protein
MHHKETNLSNEQEVIQRDDEILKLEHRINQLEVQLI